MLANMFPAQNILMSAHTTVTASKASKLKDVAKDAAKNASELAKAKAAPIYASLSANQS